MTTTQQVRDIGQGGGIMCRWISLTRVILVVLFALVLTPSGIARGHSARVRSAPRQRLYSFRSFGSTRCASCVRDSRGRIARRSAAKHNFRKNHPCPSTGSTSGACGGYVIDHVVPLKRGGADSPANMQWQTVESAKAKDRTE
jgi:hypothetical protein